MSSPGLTFMTLCAKIKKKEKKRMARQEARLTGVSYRLGQVEWLTEEIQLLQSFRAVCPLRQFGSFRFHFSEHARRTRHLLLISFSCMTLENGGHNAYWQRSIEERSESPLDPIKERLLTGPT